MSSAYVLLIMDSARVFEVQSSPVRVLQHADIYEKLLHAQPRIAVFHWVYSMGAIHCNYNPLQLTCSFFIPCLIFIYFLAETCEVSAIFYQGHACYVTREITKHFNIGKQ